MLIAYILSGLECAGVPAGVNLPLKCMEMFITFAGLSLVHVAEFSNYLHTDANFQNWPIHYVLLKPHAMKCALEKQPSI